VLFLSSRSGFTFFAIALFFAGIASSHAFGWALIDAKIRHDFPQVRRIATTDLEAWLKDSKRPVPVLLDVRTRAEFDISHLRNAEHVEPDATPSAVHVLKDQPIVTYCSVGYRSGAFAEKLRAAGYSQVSNLEGSIFRWANEGRPLVRDGKPVETVHPYNRTWGLLLQKKYRAKVVSVIAKHR